MATTVTAAHHSIWRHLYDSMHTAQKPKSKLKFVTLDKESNMSTLWRREEFLRICSKEELAEKAQDIEGTIPVEKSQETRHNLDPGSFFVNRSDSVFSKDALLPHKRERKRTGIPLNPCLVGRRVVPTAR